uniref:Nicalin n=1 Tax=Lotharella oceanica TaxID=641309 RepID=A0A7S2X6B7_9EUKA|eukprot:CAMPEP_0170184528 /NCGR_PEP_ID=MMETSP0040_2-20121228/33907_1 /TAXON_ID=641309 /ORGANISM="Lotharella oceanica, Strain CCMP622" /LENGTH=270 /DNA_ID=CAMNT_0010430619 /DNA_START=45 /DNA_END=857 /DNA_ORIENTATION=+
MNYAGTKTWIRKADSRVLEALEFVLCLEDIASGDDLYLHISRNPKDPDIRSIAENFVDTATRMDINLEVVYSELNTSDSTVNWQHEQFTKKRILGATLANHRSPRPMFEGSSIFDRSSMVNTKVLARNIKFVMESLARFIYGHPGQYMDIASHSHAVNQAFVNSWMNFLGEHPRALPFLTPQSPISRELEKTLKAHTSDVSRHSFNFESVYKFYKSSTYNTTITAFKVKPISFDIFLAVAIVAYLLLLHFFLQYGGSLKELMKALKPKAE